jgi:uncharacterized protein with PIN domain
MVVDASAILAILFDEPERGRLAAAIDADTSFSRQRSSNGLSIVKAPANITTLDTTSFRQRKRQSQPA